MPDIQGCFRCKICHLSRYNPASILHLFQFQIIASDTCDAAFGPAEFLDGFAKKFQIGHIAGFQMLFKLLLNGLHLPEVVLLVDFRGFEQIRNTCSKVDES